MTRDVNVKLEKSTCLFGCDGGDTPVIKGKDRLYNLPGCFNVVRCKTCGLLRTDPRPTNSTMGFYYPDRYNPYEQSTVQANYKPSAWKRYLRSILKINDIRIPSLEPGRMLEIGCSSGAYLHRMANQNWQVEGIEISRLAALNARSLGFNVHIGTVESAPEPTYQYDIVIGWMVVEHLHEPVKALRKLKQWTKPNGWLAISVPNAESTEFKIFKEFWYALQLPTHLYHFTPHTIARLLEYCGWKVCKIFHQQNLDNLISSTGLLLKEYKIFERAADYLVEFPQKPGLIHYLLFPVASLAAVFGQTGRMTVWARNIG